MQVVGNEIYHAPRDGYGLMPIGVEQAARGQASAAPGANNAPPTLREDTVAISDRAREAAAALEQPGAVQNQDVAVELRKEDEQAPDEQKATEQQEDQQQQAEHELSEDEQRMVDELRLSDQRVRAHEQAHAAAGAYNVRYDYQTGPDGKQYAVGGSANIDINVSSSDPDGKIQEASKMRAAALAPSDPSSEDMAVAAKASRIEMEAHAEKATEAATELELMQERQKEQVGDAAAADELQAPTPEYAGVAITG
jgi:hypothetical protein